LVGDFLFNLSCALDHIAVALNPPKRKNDLIYFPIYFENPWRRDSARRYIERDPTNRKRFTDSTRQMLPEARAYIKGSQPYEEARIYGESAEDHALVWLHRYHVTDKHRRLLAVRQGGTGGRLRWKDPASGERITEFYDFPLGSSARDGAVIKRLRYEVDMEFMGSLAVAFARNQPRPIKGIVGPFFPLAHFPVVSRTVETRLRTLEPFIQW